MAGRLPLSYGRQAVSASVPSATLMLLLFIPGLYVGCHDGQLEVECEWFQPNHPHANESSKGTSIRQAEEECRCSKDS